MKNYVTIGAAVAAIIFDIIACMADSNATVYALFTILCCASFCVYVAGLTYNGIIKEHRTDAKAVVKESRAVKKAA